MILKILGGGAAAKAFHANFFEIESAEASTSASFSRPHTCIETPRRHLKESCIYLNDCFPQRYRTSIKKRMEKKRQEDDDEKRFNRYTV